MQSDSEINAVAAEETAAASHTGVNAVVVEDTAAATHSENNAGAADESAAASHLHRSAMELSYQALNAYSSGLGKVSQELFKLALKNELAAMAVCPNEGLPSRAVLQRSAAFLAHQAGADEQAADLARHCLSGNLPKYLIQQLFDIVSSYQEPYSPF